MSHQRPAAAGGGRIAAILFALVLGTGALDAQQSGTSDSDDHAALVQRAAPKRYAPSGVPDRIILTWSDDPATTQAVTWRTDPGVPTATAEIALSGASPIAPANVRRVTGETVRLDSENGVAHHHSAVFTGLQPATVYVYRVMGNGVASEWFTFRTAAREAAPFSFLYFGDAQNDIASQWSRVVRAAYSSAPDARFMVHAGDLVSLGNGVHDDEWGGWFHAVSWVASMVPSLPATGNHEHLPPEGGGRRVHLSPHWRGHFTLPTHGPAGLEETAYHIDYQGVRVIVLNSHRADLVHEQSRWLEGLLRNNPAKWTVVTFHHPLFAPRKGRDNSIQREHWQPLLEKYGVDLVLQGHDHSYARGQVHSTGVQADGWGGPVYVVSVSGPKQALIADPDDWISRLGENLQLFQVLRVDGDTLRYQSRTTDGELYDAFQIVKPAATRGRFVDRVPDGAPARCEQMPGGAEHRCAPAVVPAMR